MSGIQSNSTDLVRHASATEIVGCRDEAIRLYTEAYRLIHEAHKMQVRATGCNHAGPDLRNMSFYDIREGKFKRDIDETRRSIDAGCWDYLLDAAGLKTFMDATAIAKFREENEKAPAEVTMDNLAATFETLSANRVEMFDRGVINLFTKLDHTFKTNPSFRLDKKIIMDGAFTQYGWNHHRDCQDQIRDLDRIMHMLDGKQPKNNAGDAAAIVGSARTRPATVHTDYFEFRIFQNGNLHILFKRPDLVLGINRIIAQHFGDAIGHDRSKRKSA